MVIPPTNNVEQPPFLTGEGTVTTNVLEALPFTASMTTIPSNAQSGPILSPARTQGHPLTLRQVRIRNFRPPYMPRFTMPQNRRDQSYGMPTFMMKNLHNTVSTFVEPVATMFLPEQGSGSATNNLGRNVQGTQHNSKVYQQDLEWKALKIGGKPGFILKEKLRILKSRLISWNKEVFGMLDLNVDKAVSSLNDLDSFVANVGSGDVWCDSVSSSRRMASKEGRFRRNNIVSLNSDEGLLTEVETIKKEIFDHFKNRFFEPRFSRSVLDGVGFKGLSEEESMLLEVLFSLEEIKNIVWLSDCDKSPGPDGFPLGFFKKTWSFVKNELLSFVQEFYIRGSLPRATTASFLAFIPKVVCPQRIDEFRPICLIGYLYRLISKLLAARLKVVMGKLISKSQSAFIEGRQLFDGVLVLNERMGFGSKWLLWMAGTVFSSSISILVNGSPTVEFQASRGLRQGDPLSPFLFLLVAEGLAGMMRNAVSDGLFKGFQVSSDISFDMLQFVDDTVLIVASSFLGCQIGKLPFVFLGIPVGGNHRRKQFWSFLISKLKKRLGGWQRKHLSLGGKVALLNAVLNSIHIFVLSFYKAPKCVLGEIIKIQRDFLWGSKEGIRKMCWVIWEKICWPQKEGGLGVRNNETFNLALVSKWGWRFISDSDAVWFNLLEYRYGGGLEALCGESSNRFLSKTSLWWRDVRFVCGFKVNNSPWFSDCISWKLGDGHYINFWEHAWLGPTPFNVLFPLLYGACFLTNFLSSSSSSSSPSALSCVADMGVWVNNVWRWNVEVAEDFLEADVACDRAFLLSMLEGVTPSPGVVDKLVWWRHVDGFSVKNSFWWLYTLKGYEVVLDDASCLELNCLWKARVPSNVKVFGWRFLINALPTRKALCLRGLDRSVINIFCPLCGLDEESLDHLFLGCAQSLFVWKEVLAWLGLTMEEIQRAMIGIHGSVLGVEVVDHFRRFLGGAIKSSFIAFLWLLVCWCIWLGRNKVVFKNSVWNRTEIVLVIKNVGWEWFSCLVRDKDICSIEDWLVNPCVFIGV
ncbi:uncharacterized protein LOC131614557 [Vicia villosa]|uniref:uncharacterized protein LOC131614557 n=1 Tax=Vicia villosa TaxID=3911 RepID=UPI00273AB1B8|nr:uncharacterized protein LOC131614557 [Vicia villosa]